MNGLLQPPDLQRSYAVSADWIELLALLRNGPASADDLTGPDDILFDRQAQLPADAVAAIEEDPDIVDPGAELALDAVFEELGFRSKILGSAYPFHLALEERRLHLSPASATGDPIIEQARLVYTACLMMSAMRAKLINAKAGGIPTDPLIGNLFQICATVAAAGYIRGDAYWFGHPRPDETSLLDAIAYIAEKLHAKAAGQAPPGESLFAKDAGIDVIAWRDHHDNRPAKMILYGQCASGMGWESKPVGPSVERIGNYFHLRPSTHWLPALLTPFPIYMDRENACGLRDEETREGFYRQTETQMGVIIDRLRIVHCCIAALRDPQPEMSSALGHLDSLFEWSQQTADALRKAA